MIPKNNIRKVLEDPDTGWIIESFNDEAIEEDSEEDSDDIFGDDSGDDSGDDF
ncbi:MAG: hypothetical protein J6Z23_08260 [Lachnospiraceae bacterium]|nr:hypothetical protein [Lachnospiraceae bacterium]